MVCGEVRQVVGEAGFNRYCTMLDKKLWNSYSRLTGQIYPCLLRLIGSYLLSVLAY